ncbi:MAG: right-handed parallel beta-helix repeat-containing protein [Clostridia bacterium]|nr:right-handed parallel beta-helix repeat-containing protein [Clostridia bacterium]
MKKILAQVLSVVMLFGGLNAFSGCFIKEKEEEKQEPYVAKQLSNESDYEKVIYVSEEAGDDNAEGTWDAPLKTIKKAKEIVSTMNDDMQGDIAVVVRRGLYTQSKTLTFDEADSGTNGHDVVYMGYPEENVRVSGGVQLTDWKKDGDLYYTPVSAKYIRDLWVNGERATLARTPNGPDYTQVANLKYRESGNGTHRYVENIYANLADLKGAESFEVVCYMEWAEPVFRVESVTEENGKGLLNIASPEREIAFETTFVYPQVRSDMYVYYQNAREFLDEPGEFYYDKEEGRLYYYPREGEDMKKVETIVSNLDKIVNITGADKDNLVQNIRFENLTFEHNVDTLVATQGYRDVQASHYVSGGRNPNLTLNAGKWDVMQAALVVERAKNIDFDGCRIQHTGSGGLLFLTNASYCEVRGNVFTDTAAYGVTIAPGADAYVEHSLYTTPFKELICHDIVVDNNYVTWAGQVFHRAVGIANMHGYNVQITNNEVAYCSSTGIHCGWGWSLNEYNAKNNYIARNNVHNFGMMASDLGGIYTLNNQPGLIIEENYVHDAASNGMGFSAYSCAEGIYLDEGTNNAIVRNNQIAYVTRNRDAIMYHIAGDNIVDEGNKCALALENNVLDENVIAAAGPQGEYKKNAPYTNLENVAKIYTSNGCQTAKEGGMYGFKIQCEKDVSVKGLGRFYIYGNRQAHKLSIYNGKKEVIASCTVDMSKGDVDQYGYKYAQFDKPVQLKKGESYFLVSEEHENGDSYLNTNTSVRIEGFTILGFARGEKLSHLKDVYNSIGFVGINLLF